MFEQTILTTPRATQKTGALFMSLAAQILICGVLLIAPLFFTGTLPALRMAKTDIFVERLPPVPKPEAPTIIPAPTATRSFNPFRPAAPTRVPQGTVSEIVVEGPMLPAGAVESGIPLLPAAVTTLAGDRFTPPPPKPAIVEPTPPTAPLQVSGGVQLAKLIKRVMPGYPSPARSTRVSGTVRLLAIIARDGHVRDLRVLSGHPLLQQAARDAVSQWVYSPTILSGQPVEVESPIDVIFELR